ncbi:MAG: M23 family metallopeptidase [Patescibacteria group bacterium]|nr:M23 family metallopeptidase [Patescibacteria group bacterium]
MKIDSISRKQSFIGIIIVLVIVGLVYGLYFYSQRNPFEAVKEPILNENSISSAPQVYISSNVLQQGDTLLINIEGDDLESEISGKFGSTKIDFFKLDNYEGLVGITGIDVKKESGKYNLVIDFSGRNKFEKEIEIIEYEFPITELLITEELKEKGYTPLRIVENIITHENVILKEIISIHTPEAYFNTVFINPLGEIDIVGAFGNIRTSGNITAQHLGVDLDALVGTPVYAVNAGVVRFSQNLNTYGKTLIIDHGLGIHSLYLHLNEFKVSNGAKVKQGDIIGLSGNTGYSIAPHLHFSIKVNGSNVNPLKFIETMKK